jgi:ubiquitin C-terminal hydrolase
MDQEHFGLVNNGATCWFNSMLQALMSVPEFLTTATGAADDSPVSNALKDFLSKSSGSVRNPAAILAELRAEYKNFGVGQEDAAEGLILLLDKLPRVVQDLFKSTWRVDIYCDTCRAIVSTGSENMYIVHMSRDHVNIVTSGDQFQEFLSGHMDPVVGYKCGTCKTTGGPTMRIVRLTDPPKILVVAFNKYLSPWSGPARAREIKITHGLVPGGRTCAAEYILMATIQHFGAPTSGHYTAMGRRGSAIWGFDDASVQPADLETRDSDYLLIYTRN